MVTFEFELTIDRPPKELFDYLKDPQKVVQWQAWAVEIVQESEGPRGAGTRLRDVR